MTNDQIMPPDLKILLNQHKADIFATLNCVQIGKIETVKSSEQTVEISLQIRRLAEDGTSEPYPVLVDCPYFVLQGGGAYIDMPIAAGDYCLVLFNDRDIDAWWSTANVADPASTRKHSFSDGIAIVGINPSIKARNHDGNLLRFINPLGVEIDGGGDAKYKVKENGKHFAGNAVTNLCTILLDLIDILKSITTAGSPAKQIVSPSSQAVLELYKEQIQALYDAEA